MLISATERIGVVPTRILIDELQATILVRTLPVVRMRMAKRELVEGAIADDDEDAAVAVTFVAHKLKPGWRARYVFEPTKRQLNLL